MNLKQKRLYLLLVITVLLAGCRVGLQPKTDSDRIVQTEGVSVGTSTVGTTENSSALTITESPSEDSVHGFRLLRQEALPDIRSTMHVYEHLKTGAELIWIQNDDPFKVFAACYKTRPSNGKGAAHIVEHAVLGGSRKYYSNDMFSDMNAISTNAFMNAYTYPDKTVFAIASKSDRDFSNLTDLYMDAVFFPTVLEDPSGFRQEGWHYDILDRNDPIVYTGVVYNEMRGAMSDPMQVLYREVLASLYPDTCYAHNSGGDPEEIPKLSYEEFLSFYQRFYHPSNALLYFYGDLEIEPFLKRVDEEYLSYFEKRDAEVHYRRQEPFTTMKRADCSYHVGADEDLRNRSYLVYSIDCGMGGNPLDYYVLSILSEALIDANGAPIKQALLDAGIGESVENFWLSHNQQSFGVCAEYAEPDDGDKMVEIVDRELRRAAKEGFDRELLYSIINQYELDMRAGNAEEGLKGLGVLDSVLASSFYGGSPDAFLRFDAIIEQLKAGVESGMFERFVGERLLGHDHKSLVLLRPEHGLIERRNAETERELEAYKKSLTAEELDALIAQNRQKDEKTRSGNLPKLNLEDVNTDLYRIDYEVRERGRSALLLSDQSTNGLVYLNAEFSLYALTAEQLGYANLLADLLGDLDTEKYTYEELEKKIRLVSGGLDFSTTVSEDVWSEIIYPRLVVQTKSTPEQLSSALDLILEVGEHSRFDDEEWIGYLISQRKRELEEELNTDGVALGLTRLRSYFSPLFKCADQMTGFDYLRFLQRLEREFEKDAGRICGELENVADRIFNRNYLLIGVAAEREDFQAIEDTVQGFLDRLPKKIYDYEESEIYAEPLNEGVPTSADVNYVMMGGDLFEATSRQLDGASEILTGIIDNLYLYPELRQKRGAYGAYSIVDGYGNLMLFSYRDPNVEETIEVLRGVGDFVSSVFLTDEELEQMIIGYFKEYPLTPDTVASVICYRFLHNLTNESLEIWAQDVKDTTLEEIHRYGDYIRAMFEEEEYFLVIGTEEQIRLQQNLFEHVYRIEQ